MVKLLSLWLGVCVESVPSLGVCRNGVEWYGPKKHKKMCVFAKIDGIW